MQWLKKKLRKWVMEASDLEKEDTQVLKGTASAVYHEHDIPEPFRFTLTKASGGTIISTRRYDNRKDRADGDLYIITDDQNLSEEVGKIVSMEMLKF
jgi:hypothetical protein